MGMEPPVKHDEIERYVFDDAHNYRSAAGRIVRHILAIKHGDILDDVKTNGPTGCNIITLCGGYKVRYQVTTDKPLSAMFVKIYGFKIGECTLSKIAHDVVAILNFIDIDTESDYCVLGDNDEMRYIMFTAY